MEVVRLPKGRAERIEARLILTRTGQWIRAVTSVKGPMQQASEFGDYETVEKAEAQAINFAQRFRADVLYIEDRT